MSAGFDAAKANPSSLLTKDNFKYLGAAAAPILADQAVTAKGPQTTTRPGMIRPYSFDPYGGSYTAGTPYEATPTKAAGGGLMGMDDGGYGPGMLDFTQKSEPVVRMAGGGVPGYAEGDLILDAYQKGNYDLANKLIGEQKLSAQDVVSKYNLNAAQAADVAKNLGYTGDLSPQKLQYGAGYVAPTPYTDTAITNFFQDLATKNARGAYSPDMYDVSGQLKDAIAQYNPDITQVNRILNSGAVVPVYGGAVAGGTDVNLKDFANEFAMATSKTPLVDANGRITLDPKLAAQAAQNELDLLFNPQRGTLMPFKDADFESGGKLYGQIGNRDKLIADFYRDPANKAKLDAAQKTVFDKYGVPENMRLAPRAISTNLAQTDIAALPSAYVDPSKFTNYKDYAAAQNAASLKAFEDEIAINKKYGIDLLQRFKTGDVPSPAEVKLANLRAGLMRDGVLPGEQNRFTGATAGVNTGVSGGINTIPITYNTAGTNAPGGLESILGLPPGVSGAGITTVNPNGTITTRPDIPGIEDGFTGMTDVRDTYEKGGGSLGVNKNLFVPKTQDELFARYKNTGGSKAAFDYLMGKTPYSPTPYTPTGEIMKPYLESVGRAPVNMATKKYVYVNGKYQLNPDYVKPSYVLAGEKAAALADPDNPPTAKAGEGKKWVWSDEAKKWEAKPINAVVDTPVTGQNDGGGGGDANGGLMSMARGGMAQQFNLGDYSDGGRLLRGPGDGVSDSIPASIGGKRPARLADGEFVVPARIVSELGNGSTEAGARKLYAMMDRIQKARRGTVGKGRVAKNSRSEKYLPA
jgi:hypothetical protein